MELRLINVKFLAVINFTTFGLLSLILEKAKIDCVTTSDEKSRQEVPRD